MISDAQCLRLQFTARLKQTVHMPYLWQAALAAVPPGLMISTAWVYNTTDITDPITALQQNLEMCATVPPFCGVAPLSTGGTSYWTFAQQRCRQSLTILDFSFLRQGEPRIMPHHSQNGCLSTRNGAICILNISPDIIVPSISSSKRSISKRFSYRWYLSITCFSANRRWPDHSFHYVDIIKRSVWIYSCFKFLLVRIPSSSLCYQIFALFFLCCTH